MCFSFVLHVEINSSKIVGMFIANTEKKKEQ